MSSRKSRSSAKNKVMDEDQKNSAGGNNQVKTKTPSSSSDVVKNDKTNRKIIESILTAVKSLELDGAQVIIPILESLLKIGDCVEKRDLRYALLNNYTSYIQECTAVEVLQLAKDMRDVMRSKELKKLIVDDDSLEETNILIGKGSFSMVSLGYLKQSKGTKLKVAIKQLPLILRQYIINEAEIMVHLNHKNIVKICAFQMGNEPKLAMEYCEFGDLITCIQKHDFSNAQLRGFILDIAFGMEYMTAQKYVHCDLACRNIFVNKDLVCKIGDFGLSQYVGDTDGIYDIGDEENTNLNIPPEARGLRNQKLSWKTDVWSMGVLIWEMFCLSKNTMELCFRRVLLYHLYHGEINELPNIGSCPRPLYFYITTKLMHADPNKRPNFTMIKDTIAGML